MVDFKNDIVSDRASVRHIFSDDSKQDLKKGQNKMSTLPILPLKNIVIFPHSVVPLFVTREKSLKALDALEKTDRNVLLVTQKDMDIDHPKAKDLYKIGVLAKVLQILNLPDGTVKILVDAQTRVRLSAFSDKNGYLSAASTILSEKTTGFSEEELVALGKELFTKFEAFAHANKRISTEMLSSVSQIKSHSQLADTITGYISLNISEKQKLLEALNVGERIKKISLHLDAELEVLKLDERLQERVKKQMEKSQKEYFLAEQMKAIQKELEDTGSDADELGVLERKIKRLKMSSDAKEKSLQDLKKLRNMNPMSPENTILRNYLETITALPWGKFSTLSSSLSKAETVLNKRHYALDKVKDRIIEYLAVQSRSKQLKGPILCLVGPPGVGKTSLARSIAEATGRRLSRISLGGIKDESEIRGHRRTYIGALPGRIIQGIKKAGTSNPLMLLDEIDKVGSDWRGDPSSALLEVLDPEQNSAFVDHYLEVGYDLSKVLFIATANSLDMPAPLLDRMEIINLSGYSEKEKLEIARQHLVKKQAQENNLGEEEWLVSDDAILEIIRSYTREAGVRGLERELGKIARKIVKEHVISGEKTHVEVTQKSLSHYLGVVRYSHLRSYNDKCIGSVNGLAWTAAGGELLKIEALLMFGTGKIQSTGKLGEVMQESLSAAFSWVKAHAPEMGIPKFLLEKRDVHVHLPEGAVPKDGPSAGIALVLVLSSIFTGLAVKQSIAMTGEVTLQGRVLAIGGLKEKLLAALRSGIQKVLIPKENEKDLPEMEKEVLENLEIIPVRDVKEVLREALVVEGTPLALLESSFSPEKVQKSVLSQSLYP
ncbi:endopeptidase La [Acetobacteraceae bacterium]|nr:endopeptidase La [Acetobacteraceae bacterium]